MKHMNNTETFSTDIHDITVTVLDGSGSWGRGHDIDFDPADINGWTLAQITACFTADAAGDELSIDITVAS